MTKFPKSLAAARAHQPGLLALGEEVLKICETLLSETELKGGQRLFKTVQFIARSAEFDGYSEYPLNS